MFATDLAIGNSVVTTYSLTSIADGKSIRRDATAPLGAPRTLTISHGKKNPKDPKSPDRHLVRIDWDRSTAAGLIETLSAYLVVESPESTTFVDADYVAVFQQLDAIMVGGGGALRAKLLNNEP